MRDRDKDRDRDRNRERRREREVVVEKYEGGKEGDMKSKSFIIINTRHTQVTLR